MSRARDAAHKKLIGKKQIAESRAKTPIRDILSNDSDRRKERLDQAREGARNLIDGTIVINKLKRLRDSQSTDSSQ